MLQFYRLCLKYLNLNSIEHDKLIVFLNQIEDYHESYADEYFVLEKDGISDDHYIRSLKVGFHHMVFFHFNHDVASPILYIGYTVYRLYIVQS